MMRYEIFVVDRDRLTGHGIVVGALHGSPNFEEFLFDMENGALLNIRKFNDPQFHGLMRFNPHVAKDIYRIVKREMEKTEAAQKHGGTAARTAILRPMFDKLRVLCAVANMSSKAGQINDAERLKKIKGTRL